MQFSAAQIALLINGKTEGDANVTVGSFGKIEEAGEGQLAFLANPKYEEYLYTTGASVIIINESLELKQPVKATVIRVLDALQTDELCPCNWKKGEETLTTQLSMN